MNRASHTASDEPSTEPVLVARLADGRDRPAIGYSAQEPSVVVDHLTLADLVREALVETRRVHGSQAGDWWGAAEAASLIIRHVSETTTSTD